MLREYHKWHSPALSRDMELLVFGHHGAKVIVFPTSEGRFFDWENRRMNDPIQEHIDNGWVQLFCVDGVDSESWFNGHVSAHDRGRRHLQYHDYIIGEVLPFMRSKNDNAYTIATGCSFGAYHSFSIALRYPEHFNRVLGMSGVYDVRDWTGGYMDDTIIQGSPCEYMAHLHDGYKLDQIRNLDMIIAIGNEDPLFGNNKWFSDLLWDKGIWHAFKEWNGFAHDWPEWEQMIRLYIGGAN